VQVALLTFCCAPSPLRKLQRSLSRYLVDRFPQASSRSRRRNSIIQVAQSQLSGCWVWRRRETLINRSGRASAVARSTENRQRCHSPTEAGAHLHCLHPPMPTTSTWAQQFDRYEGRFRDRLLNSDCRVSRLQHPTRRTIRVIHQRFHRSTKEYQQQHRRPQPFRRGCFRPPFIPHHPSSRQPGLPSDPTSSSRCARRGQRQ
jgi:hypothetical protein